jgi:hypothetical protein
MPLSSLIVQRDVATMRQVEEALARQVIYGGDLVTNLFEVARVDEAVLTPLLAESMHLAPAPHGELPLPDDVVRALISADVAVQYGAVPLDVEGERLVLVVAEPLSPEIHDELARSVGMDIEELAAPAVRVWQSIARTYGVELDRRMQRLLGRLSGESKGSSATPVNAPGLSPSLASPAGRTSSPPSHVPGGPPTVGAVARPSGAVAARRRSAERHPTWTSFPEGRASTPLPADVSSRPNLTGRSSLPVSTGVGAARHELLQRNVTPNLRPGRRRRGPLTLEALRREGEEASDRDTLLDLFFDFARQFFDYAALFLVQGDIAEGRDSFGGGASRERVLGIGVPLDLPSFLSSAREKRSPVVGRALEGGLDMVLLGDLQRPRDVEVAVVPMVVRTRAVALLVGDCAESGIDRDAVQQVLTCARIIGKCFERIIVRRKLEGFVAGSRIPGEGRITPAVSIAEPPAPLASSSLPSASSPPVESSPPIASSPVARAASDRPLFPSPSFAPSSAPPPPAANIASVRPVGGPPIPREEPNSGVAIPPHWPAPAHQLVEDPLPTIIIDTQSELEAIVDRVIRGEGDEPAEWELLRQGVRAMSALMTRFPGPVTFERARLASLAHPPRASECGPVLRLVARERKVALPFVLERLADQDAETRGWATYLLAELPYVEALPALLERLRDDDASTRVSAARAIAAVARASSGRVVAASLRTLARSADSHEREAAMRALSEIREPWAVPDLVVGLRDDDDDVVARAHAGLVLVTRQDFRRDWRAWSKWWDQNGTRHRLEWLIDALTHDLSELRRAAGEELRSLSHQYFGYASDLPARDRERAQQRYRDWWITEGRARNRQS